MPRIDLHNYEAFLLDYFEGNLDGEILASLKAFLLAHPELDIDLGDTALPYLSEEDVSVADFKSALKKEDLPLQDERLLDYLENNLSEKQRAAFESELAIDQELAKALEYYKKTILLPGNEVFEFKPGLYKTDEQLILKDPVIAYVEDQLSSEEKSEFEKELLVNKDLQREFQLVSKTVLTYDAAVVYPDKEALKKESRVIALFGWRTVTSIAAAMLLLLGIALVYNYYSGASPEVKGGLADHSKSKPVKTNTDTAVETSTVAQAHHDIEKNETKQNSSSTPPLHPQVNQRAIQNVTLVTPPTFNGQNTSQLADQKETKKEDKTISSPEQKTVEQTPTQLAAALPENNGDSIINKQNYLLLAEDSSDEDFRGSQDAKKGFWKRAVSIAKQANKLGVKSIDGQENSENKYRLSFNSFSVEKK